MLDRSGSFLLRALLLGAILWLALFVAPVYAADGETATPSVLADTTSWALLLGAFTPLLTSLVQQPTWTPRLRVAVSVGVSLVIGLGTLLANGAFNDGAQTVLSVLAATVLASATAYRTIWKPAGVAPAIENATAVAGRSSDPASP